MAIIGNISGVRVICKINFSAIQYSFSFFVEQLTGLMATPSSVQRVNIWVFVDIFDVPSWLFLGVNTLLLTSGFLLVSSTEYGHEQEDGHIFVFDTIARVVFVITQLGYEYQVICKHNLILS